MESSDGITGLSAAVLLAEGSEEIETLAPANVLVRAGVRVEIIGVNGLDPRGSRGLPMRADRLVGAIRGTLYDALIIPGGGDGAENIAASESSLLLIRHHAAEGRLIGAICAAPGVVLGPIGLLNRRRATGYPSTRPMFPPTASYVEEPIVRDGTLITAQGPATALAFGLALAAALVGEHAAAEVARAMLAPWPAA